MIAVATMALASRDAGEFQLRDSDAAKGAHGATKSKIVATKTEAAMKFFVTDKEKGPIKGVVICLASPTSAKYCTDETDAEGYAEVLVPVGQKYDVTYLSLGGGDIATTVSVTNEPKQNIKLTLRYKPLPPRTPFVLKGVNFDTGTAVLRHESALRLDLVVDFMKRRKSRRRRGLGPHRQRRECEKEQSALDEARAGVPRLPDLQRHRGQPHHRRRLRRRATHRPE